MIRPLSCRRVRRLLPLFVGGDLGDEQVRFVESHVEECDACAAELSVYERSRQSLFALKATPREPAPDLWPAIRLRIGASRPAKRRFPLRAAAAILLAAGAGLALLFGPGEGPTPTPQAPPVAKEIPPVEPGVALGTGEFLLAEVGPATGPETFTEFPSVRPADTERSDWDEF
jgi:hypothetical protein